MLQNCPQCAWHQALGQMQGTPTDSAVFLFPKDQDVVTYDDMKVRDSSNQMLQMSGGGDQGAISATCRGRKLQQHHGRSGR